MSDCFRFFRSRHFLFTGDQASWECTVENGKWVVEVCVGDPGREQVGQKVTIEGKTALSNVDTPAGVFHEVTIEVEALDQRVTIALGSRKPGGKMCRNGVRFRPVPGGTE